MDRITVITPPDKLLNSSPSLFLITPSVYVKNQVQDFINTYTYDLNLYMYTEEDRNIEWVLNTIHIADYTVYDLDNSSPELRNFSSYIISKNKVFYLTNDSSTPYNLISNNRIYELSFLTSLFKGDNN
jgi:hypothetical protein